MNDERFNRTQGAFARNLVTKACLDVRLAEFKSDFKSDLIKWMAGMLIAQGVVVVALVKLL